MSIFQVFGALMEYGVILLLLKKRLKPTYSISFGLKKMFPNGEASSQQLPTQQPQQHQVKKRRTPGSPAGNATTMLGVGEIEEQKPMVCSTNMMMPQPAHTKVLVMCDSYSYFWSPCFLLRGVINDVTTIWTWFSSFPPIVSHGGFPLFLCLFLQMKTYQNHQL